MNTANKLTMLRVALIPVFLILLYLRFPFHMYFALTVFILASVTDFVDGYIARHYLSLIHISGRSPTFSPGKTGGWRM